MGALAVPKLSVEEYLAADRASEIRSEYHDGEVLPIQAASWQHAKLSIKVGRLFDERLASTPCEVVGPVRVRINPKQFVYPDLLVVCGKPVFADERTDTVTNPKVVIEIMSPSTMDYDHGSKFEAYRALPSFEEYVLISQTAARIEVFRKTSDSQWVLTIFEGLEAVALIESVGVSLPLAAVYESVL